MRSPQWEHSRRNGVKACVEWLHAWAETMNDPHARSILNTAGWNMGVKLKQHNPPQTSSSDNGEGDVEGLVDQFQRSLEAEYEGLSGKEFARFRLDFLRELASAISKLKGERDELAARLRDGWASDDRRVAPVLLEKSMGQAFIWVVWAVKPGAVRLLAVCSDERHADHYCENMPPGLAGFKAWKELAPLDHGFGFADSMHARVQGKL